MKRALPLVKPEGGIFMLVPPPTPTFPLAPAHARQPQAHTRLPPLCVCVFNPMSVADTACNLCLSSRVLL